MSSLEKKTRLKRLENKRGKVRLEVYEMDFDDPNLFHTNLDRSPWDPDDPPDEVFTREQLDALPDDPGVVRILLVWEDAKPEET